MNLLRFLNEVLEALNAIYLHIPLERHKDLYRAICDKTAEFVEADVCSLFLRDSASDPPLPSQSVYMVASNPESPWDRASRHLQVRYQERTVGTTTRIWTDGRPRICNNLAHISEMRGTSTFPGRPGLFDPDVWVGRNPWGCFRNFIAIPVRISPFAPGDENEDPKRPITSIVGILKAENKTLPRDRLNESYESHQRQGTRLGQLTKEQFSFFQRLLSPDFDGTSKVSEVFKELGIERTEAEKQLENLAQPGALLSRIWDEPLQAVLGCPEIREGNGLCYERTTLTEQVVATRETFLRVVAPLLPQFDPKDMIILVQVAQYVARLEELRLTRKAADAGLPLAGSHFHDLPGLIDYQFISDYKKCHERLLPVLKHLVNHLRVELEAEHLITGDPEAKVTYRVKAGASFLNKLLKRRNRKRIHKYHSSRQFVPFRQLIDIEHLDIDDLGGIRVTCDFPKQALEVVAHIRNEWKDSVMVLVEDVKHPEVKAEEEEEQPADTGYHAIHLTLLTGDDLVGRAPPGLIEFAGQLERFLNQKRSTDPVYQLLYSAHQRAEEHIRDRFNEDTYRALMRATQKLRDYERELTREFVRAVTEESVGGIHERCLRIELQVRTAQHDIWADKYHRGFYRRFHQIQAALHSEKTRLEAAGDELKKGERIRLVECSDQLEQLKEARETYVATARGIDEEDVKLQMASDQMDRIEEWCEEEKIIE